MFQGTGILNFLEYFKDDEDCKSYLYDIKWHQGYECKSCGHTGWCDTKDPYVRKCNRCKYKESATAHTLFHKCKFSLRKAFLIVYYMSVKKKGISSHELSRQLELRQKTCWLFQQKVRQAMKSSKQHPMKGKVEVDEFVIGGPEEGKKGRSQGKKKLVVLGIECDDFGIHRFYARHIENAGAKQLRPFFEDHIDPLAAVRTDKWRSYKTISQDYPNLVQEKSEKGKNFKKLHRQVMMIKGWLRGTYHHCLHLQHYLDEHSYRFNRLKTIGTIFNNLIKKMIKANPVTYNDLKLIWGS